MLRDEGRTIVVSTQYVGESAMCDVVAVMVEGRLLTVAPPDELRRAAFGGDVVHVTPERGWMTAVELQAVAALPQVVSATRDDDRVRIVLRSLDDVSSLATHFEQAGLAVGTIDTVPPTFDEVFVALMRGAESQAAVGVT